MSSDASTADFLQMRANRAPNRRPNFTPFIEAMETRVKSATRELLGLPESVPLVLQTRPADVGKAIATIGSGDQRLRLSLQLGRHPAWFASERLSVDPLDQREGDRRLLNQLHRRLVALVQTPDVPAIAELEEVLPELLRFHGVRDSMLRWVTDDEALVRLGFRCNQRCEFCWQSRQWPDPPNEFYPLWVDEIAAAGIDRITFSGGEPTIHRDFFALVDRARDHGMDIIIQTNAVQIAKPGFAERLASAGVKILFVSFHSHDPAISDSMTASPATHMRTRAGIRAALAAGIKVHLNSVIENRNFSQLGGHARFIVENFVEPFPDNPILCVEYSHPSQYFLKDLWDAASAPLDLVRPHLVEALQVLNKAQVPVSGIGTCGFPPCLLKGSDIPIRSMDRSEESEWDISGRLYVEACDTCVLKRECLGLRREYIDRHGDRGISPFTELPPNLIRSEPQD